MECPRRDGELVERYLLDRLSESERESFERHLFECPECAEDLATLEAIREALQRAPVEPVARPVSASKWFAGVVAVAAVAAGVAFGLWTFREPAIPVSSAPPAEHVPPAATAEVVEPPGVSPELRALAEIRAPEYVPTVLRGAGSDAERAFRIAMAPYREGNWAGAIEGLRPIAADSPADPRVGFYLGASCLLAGRTDAGIAQLERVVGLGDSAFLEDSHLLLAKARIGKGEFDRAKEDLRAVLALEGDREEEARGLLGVLSKERRNR